MEKDLLLMYQKHLDILTKEKKMNDLEDLKNDFLVKYTYDAISLEGNSKLPFEDVKRIIEIDLLVDKNNKQELEIINHINAYNKVLELSKSNKDLTEEQLKDIHDILLKDIMVGGVYRNVNISITGAAHQPPDYIKVYDRMKKTFTYIKESNLDDFSKGIYLHANIAKVYPFLDGNGRVARLALNYYLLKGGYLPISIPLDLRDEYFKNLEIYKVDKDIAPLTKLIKKLVILRYEDVLEQIDN